MDYLVLNELSFTFPHKTHAYNGIEQFVKSFGAASRLGFRQLRLHRNIGDNLYYIELAPGYRIANWLRDGTIPVEVKNRFKEICVSN